MRRFVLLIVIGLVTPSAVTAAVPSQMSIQGRLLNAGNPMNGSHPADFKIFDALTNGNILWAESSSLIATGGIFSATIGSTTPIPTIVFDAQPRWLEVTVDGTTLNPRLPLTTSAFAFKAEHADTANFSLNSPSAGDNVWSTNGTDVWRAAGSAGIGTTSPSYSLDVRSADYLHGLNWQVTSGTETGSYVRFGSNNSRGALWIGNDTPLGGGPPDGAGLLQTTGGWQWNKQLNIMGNVGIGTNSPTNTLQVAGGVTAVGVASGTFNTLGAVLGNGSVYSLLDDSHLEFHGTYGYAVGDEYLDFQSQFNPAVGGQGTMARIIGNRNPEDYDLGRGRLKLSVRNGGALTDMLVVDYQGVSIPGNLNVGGTKCREVDDPKYGKLYFNAVESGTADFTDRGEGQLANGKCHIELNQKWLAGVTIDDAHPMQVTITAYYGRHGGQEYVERTTSGFTLIDPSGSNAAFGWRVEARQEGYEDLYLNRPELSASR